MPSPPVGGNGAKGAEEPEDTHYDALDLTEAATMDEIRRAFRRKALTCHPDKHPGDSEKEEIFKRLQAANAILSDEEARKKYDGELARKGPLWRERQKSKKQRKQATKDYDEWQEQMNKLRKDMQECSDKWGDCEKEFKLRSKTSDADRKVAMLNQEIGKLERQIYERESEAQRKTRAQVGGAWDSPGKENPPSPQPPPAPKQPAISPELATELEDLRRERAAFLDETDPTNQPSGATERLDEIQNFIKKLKRNRRRHFADLTLLRSAPTHTSGGRRLEGEGQSEP